MRRTATLLWALGTAACVGEIGPAGGDPGGDAPDPPSSVECAPPAAAARRLTAREYRATIGDLLGEGFDLSALEADTYYAGFDNGVATLNVGTPHVKAYMATAQSVARAVISDQAKRSSVIGCDEPPPAGAPCLRDFVRSFGALAFRRPLEAQEEASLLALAAEAADDPDPWRSAQLVLEAVLQSPQFLYRIETGRADAEDSSVLRPTPFEMASRLSFLVWGSAPDSWLLGEAADGGLDDVEGIRSIAGAMLADPRSQRGLETFAFQWLDLAQLDTAQRSVGEYPEWSESLRGAMREETRRILADHIRGPSSSLLDVLTADYTYVNSELGALYGFPAPDPAETGDDGWYRANLAETPTRVGLLSHASVLTMTAGAETNAPIRRGKFIREVFLCSVQTLPKGGVPPEEPLRPGQSIREHLAEHQANPGCRGCHANMDPIGFGLERYDLIGRYRDRDAFGNALSGAGELSDFDPAAFVGPGELAERLATDPRTKACVVTRLLRYATGNAPSPEDQCTVDEVTRAFDAAGGSLPTTILELVSNDRFRTIGRNDP